MLPYVIRPRRRFSRIHPRLRIPVFCLLIFTFLALRPNPPGAFLSLTSFRARPPASSMPPLQKLSTLEALHEILPEPHPPLRDNPRLPNIPITIENDAHVDTLDIIPASAPSSVPSSASPSPQSVPSSATTLSSIPIPPISAIVLFHDEYDTLNHTLYTWRPLLSLLSDVLIFHNGASPHNSLRIRLPYLFESPWSERVRVHASPQNLPLGLAIADMVTQAREQNVLLLEKDWALIEPPQQARLQLATAVTLLDRTVAHVVRFRHRHFPGAPLHARMMHDGREHAMLTEQKNLYCYMHHWVNDLSHRYSDFFRHCPGTDNSTDPIWCASAKYCQWTNNPALFKKDWFTKELGDRFVNHYHETKKNDPKSNMLDFEFYTNWKSEVWNDRDFVIALPKGLFEHQEIGEQNLMNTVWYAWNRLSKDVDEKRHHFLASAHQICSGDNNGRQLSLNSPRNVDSGRPFREIYPISFVRHYSYSHAMKRNMTEGVAEIRETALMLREQLENGHGGWRNGITDLTNLWYKVSLFVYPSEPEDMRIGFVTTLYHTDEGLDDGGRSFKGDVDAAAANLHALSNYRLIVYCSPATKNALRQTLVNTYRWKENEAGLQSLSNILFAVSAPLDKLLERLLSAENMNRVQQLRQTEGYISRVKQRKGAMAGEKALQLALTKPYILDDAITQAKSGPESHSDVSHLVWFDATSPCIGMARNEKGHATDPVLGPSNDHILRSQLFLHAFGTSVHIGSDAELETALSGSGFDRDVLLAEMERPNASDMRLLDLRTFGGSLMAIALMTGYYDIALRSMLRKQQLGSGREAMTIAWNNVKYNFRTFDALTGCERNLDGDHSCAAETGFTQVSYRPDAARSMCQLYRWAGGCSAR